MVDHMTKSVIDSKLYESKLKELNKREPSDDTANETELTQQILTHIREQIQISKSLLSVYQSRLESSNLGKSIIYTNCHK